MDQKRREKQLYSSDQNKGLKREKYNGGVDEDDAVDDKTRMHPDEKEIVNRSSVVASKTTVINGNKR